MNHFAQYVTDVDASAARAVRIDTLMVNIGLRCNMACAHCHQSSSPARTEAMSAEDIETVAGIAARIRPLLVDITGGAPELHPGLRRLISLVTESGLNAQIRTNLTALLEPESEGLIDFLARNRVRVLASLSGTSAQESSMRQGDVFERSIVALRRLMDAGYGSIPGLRLDIAVNPIGATLPDPRTLEERFRAELEGDLGILFEEFVTITNVPIGRMREKLSRSGELGAYREALRLAFNPRTVERLACRYSLEIAWDGTFSDCDFNLGAGLRVADGVPAHISEFDLRALSTRPIRFADHCFACTADAGSG